MKKIFKNYLIVLLFISIIIFIILWLNNKPKRTFTEGEYAGNGTAQTTVGGKNGGPIPQNDIYE